MSRFLTRFADDNTEISDAQSVSPSESSSSAAASTHSSVTSTEDSSPTYFQEAWDASFGFPALDQDCDWSIDFESNNFPETMPPSDVPSVYSPPNELQEQGAKDASSGLADGLGLPIHSLKADVGGTSPAIQDIPTRSRLTPILPRPVPDSGPGSWNPYAVPGPHFASATYHPPASTSPAGVSPARVIARKGTTSELSPEQKRQRNLARNRIAAAKSRERKREYARCLEEKKDVLEREHRLLALHVTYLRDQVTHLRSVLSAIQSECHCGMARTGFPFDVLPSLSHAAEPRGM